jgi:hypothetical protein
MIYIPYSRITDWIRPQGHPGLSMSLQVRGRQGPLPLAAKPGRSLQSARSRGSSN